MIAPVRRVPKHDPLELATCTCGHDLFSHRKHTACVECNCSEFVEKEETIESN